MAGPYREKIFGIAVKIEATSGTDSVPTAATDAIRVVGVPELEWDFLESGERDDVQTGQMGSADPAAPAGRWGRIPITVEVKGSGAAGTAPEYDALMLMSGHSKTVSAGVSVLYTTIDTGTQTGTVYAWSAGKLFKLVGCSATLELKADATKRGFKTFIVTGVMASDPTEVALPALTLSTVVPPLFIAAATSIGAWTQATAGDPLVVKSASVNEGIVITERPGAGATDGLIGYLITDRKPRQTIVAEVPAIATYDPFAAAKAAGSAGPLTSWQIGTLAGNRLKVQTGRWRSKAPKLGAQNGVMVMTMDGVLGIGSAPTTNREINYLYD
jgi:hypothetical protein